MSRPEPPSRDRDILSLWSSIADREARLLSLVEASAQVVWITDKNGSVPINPPQELEHLTWHNFTGYPQASMRDMNWLDAVHPQDKASVVAVVRHSVATGDPILAEFRVHHHSGEWRSVLARGKSIRDSAGGIVGFVGTCTDISSLRKTEAALRDSQQRLLAALEAGEISTWIWRLADGTFWWDDAAAKLWGVPPGQPLGQRLEDLYARIHLEDRAGVQAAFLATERSGLGLSVEFRTQRADGKLQWLSGRGCVQSDAAGPAQVAGAFTDITKLKVAEESLRHSQKMQALGTLAGGVAHDFNNLLLAISGNARLVLDALSEADPHRAALQEIVKVSSRANELVQRILTFSTRQLPVPGRTSIRTAIEEALALLRSSVPDNIALQVHHTAQDLTCVLSADELQQVMVNLITNAVHAIGARNGSIEIDVNEGEPPAQVAGNRQGPTRAACIRVRDSGRGMDAATRQRMFDPFFTTKPFGQGTGLGLAVVHGIVQGCGGCIEVMSEVNAGSTLTLWVPLSTPQAATRTGGLSDYRGHGEHILYVDDEEALTFLIERVLSGKGYRVTCCNSPTAALELLRGAAHSIDVLVSDLTMPALNGIDLIHHARAIRPDLPAILTSGYVRDEDRERARQVGIEHVILKPNTIDEMGATLHQLFEQIRQRHN